MAGRPRRVRSALRLVHLHGYMFFAHGPTILTNRVRYDTKRHFLKIFFVVYSIITIGCRMHARTVGWPLSLLPTQWLAAFIAKDTSINLQVAELEQHTYGIRNDRHWAGHN